MQIVSTLAGENIDISKRLRYWALVCMSFESANVIRLSVHILVQQMLGRGGQEIFPPPLTLKRDLESSPAITLSHQQLTCVTNIFFEESENCAFYIIFFFFFINETSNFAFASNFFGKFI